METTHKARILVAVMPRATATLAATLACDFDLTFCHTLEETQSRLVDASFDLILCGVHFDDSRMFDLLHYAKANPGTKTVPFVCIKAFQGILHTGSYDGVRKACALLEVAAFIDLSQWRNKFGEQQADEQLRTTLHHLVWETYKVGEHVGCAIKANTR